MTRGILTGLAHLHQRRIIHRDLKPDNILLQGDTPRLADFGLSRVFKSTNFSANIAGTPVYMAPEAFKNRRNEQTDLWSVGVILYQMLSGRLPFEGDDIPTIYVAVRNEEPAPLPATVPLWLREIVARSLSKDPGQRYLGAVEMRRDLNEAKLRHEQAEAARQRREVEQQRALAEQQQRAKEAQSQAERERLQRENAELQQRLLENQQPQPPISAQDFSSALPATLIIPPSNKRRRLIAAVVIAAAVVIVGVSSWLLTRTTLTPQTTTPLTVAPLLRTVSFETVSLTNRGSVLARETKQARSFTEDLGNGVTLEMIEIPSGELMMGSTDAEVQTAWAEAKRYDKYAPLEWFSRETPRHRVTLPTFFMGRFEVTRAQWRAVMGGDPSSFKGDKLPVGNVSWNDVKEFCAQLSKKTGKLYRLPSEAEWEYAARAGTTTPFAFGETITPEIVNYVGTYPSKGKNHPYIIIPVGSLGAANAFGLYDMHGNVWEWCEDVWHDDYNGAPTDGSAWTSGGDQSYRVLRGGSLLSFGWDCRAANRNIYEPGVRLLDNGFRVMIAARTRP